MCLTEFSENGLIYQNIPVLHLTNWKLKSVLCDWGPCSTFLERVSESYPTTTFLIEKRNVWQKIFLQTVLLFYEIYLRLLHQKTHVFHMITDFFANQRKTSFYSLYIHSFSTLLIQVVCENVPFFDFYHVSALVYYTLLFSGLSITAFMSWTALL